tara:strand:+ start:668 stop:847 length:180 start_codon:yes stop_codon:yes gene_type:complete
MKTNKDETSVLKLIVWSGLMVGSIVIWYSIFTNGFFITTMWIIIISAIIGIWLRVSGRA